jgi:hypothetical protein
VGNSATNTQDKGPQQPSAVVAGVDGPAGIDRAHIADAVRTLVTLRLTTA